VKTRGLLQCRYCRHQGSLTAGTVFAYSELPLTIWFLAMYLLTQQKNALSAPELMRHLGASYPAAWSLEHKLRKVMHERDAQRKLALHSTHHKVSAQHLPCYLADFCYRFNRRFDLAAMLPCQGYAAAHAPLMRYRLLNLVEVHWQSGLGFRFHWGERPCLMQA
jgi:hypothetical protein